LLPERVEASLALANALGDADRCDEVPEPEDPIDERAQRMPVTNRRPTRAPWIPPLWVLGMMALGTIRCAAAAAAAPSATRGWWWPTGAGQTVDLLVSLIAMREESGAPIARSAVA